MRLLMFFLIYLAIFSCKKTEKEMKTAAAKVQFANDTADLAIASNSGVPSSLEVILLYARLIQDIDDNSQALGGPGFIYINPDCQKSDEEIAAEKKAADVENPVIATDDVDGCAHQNDSWKSNGKTMKVKKIANNTIDLAEGTSAVNEALNSQNRKIELEEVEEDEDASATFRYAGIAFRIESHTDEPNAFWSFEDTGAEGEFNWLQSEIIVKLKKPLTINDGEKAVVKLSYDLEGSIQYGADLDMNEKDPDSGTYQPGSADDCFGTMGSADYTCVTIPEMTASFTKK